MFTVLRRLANAFGCLLLACVVALPVGAQSQFRNAQTNALRDAKLDLDRTFKGVTRRQFAEGFNALPESTRDQAINLAMKLTSTGSRKVEKIKLFIELSNSTRIKFPEGRKGDDLFQVFWRQFAEQLDSRMRPEARRTE
jgi:hypothetical protein